MKKLVHIGGFGLLILSTALGGCFLLGAPPISKMCTYEGSHSGNMVKVRCTGIGYDDTSAMIDAKKAASWYVVSRILKTREERERFSKISQEFYKRYNTFVASVHTDGKIEVDDDGRILVKAILEVNRGHIIEFLKDFGVTDHQEMLEEIGNPTIAVVARWKTHDQAWNAFVLNAAKEYLTERRYNAIDLQDGIRNLDKLGQKILKLEGLPGDPKTRAAMMMGADIFIKVSAHNRVSGPYVKGVASIIAYETTTGRLLGSSSAFGKEYPLRAGRQFQTVKQAIQNAMDNVLQQVLGYWKGDVVKGNRFFVIIAGNLGEDTGDYISLQLKRTKGFSEVKCPLITEKRVHCTFRSKIELPELRIKLKETLRSVRNIKKLHRAIATRKFFLFIANFDSSKDTDPDSLPLSLR